MLKKIRFRIVLVIMCIVVVFLGIVFGSIMHFTMQNIEQENIRIMERITTDSPKPPPPNTPNTPHFQEYDLRISFFILSFDTDGNILATGGDFFDLSDEETLKKLVDIAESEDDIIGVISEYNLRYMIKDNCIVFADISEERMILSGLIRNAVIIGFFGILTFLFISIFLSKWLTKPMEKAWNEQKQFIADASHELKTPLTVIMTNVEMLTDHGYSDLEKRNFTKNILSMSKRMRGLVESLLQLARMDNGTSIKIQDEINFSKIVSDSILPFEPLFFEKNMILSSDIQKDIYIYADKNKIRQIIDILLDNALKYSEEDTPVNIKLSSYATGCLLSVSGKGAHLSPEECKNIFRRFYRADESRNDGNSYGLGLSIADGIVKEYNGKIHAESTDGINTFYVQFDTKKHK